MDSNNSNIDSFGTVYTDKTIRRERNVRSEVMNKDFDPTAVIDAYEQARGIRKKGNKLDTDEFEFKSIVLDPEQPKDNDMLSLLMNDSKYIITLYKDNWTPQGTYRVFVIYGKRKETTKDKTNES